MKPISATRAKRLLTGLAIAWAIFSASLVFTLHDLHPGWYGAPAVWFAFLGIAGTVTILAGAAIAIAAISIGRQDATPHANSEACR